jgi:hypothetical protein
MRLSEVFGDCAKLAPLLRAACATDDGDDFAARVVARDDGVLLRAVTASARVFAERAGIAEGAVRSSVESGQQPYVDYYPAVLAKLDVLERHGGFFTFADYVAMRSDPFIVRTEIPCAGTETGLLRLGVHRLRPYRHHDLRFVAPPDAAALNDFAAKLATLAGTARLDRSKARVAMRALLDDYGEARRRARHVGEFNAIWSARVFRRLGFTMPLVSLSDLCERLIPHIAGTLALFIERRELVAESVAEALRRGGEALHFTPKDATHVPLAIAGDDGNRRPVRLEKPGVLAAGDERFPFSDAASLEELLHRLHGRWSLDVFSPIFFYRLGAAGTVSGRGSIRYSLVLGHVFARVFGEAHPPNLLCSATVPPSGPFVEAVRRAHGELPAAVRQWEPTLVARLLANDEPTVRAEIGASWH